MNLDLVSGVLGYDFFPMRQNLTQMLKIPVVQGQYPIKSFVMVLPVQRPLHLNINSSELMSVISIHLKQDIILRLTHTKFLPLTLPEKVETSQIRFLPELMVIHRQISHLQQTLWILGLGLIYSESAQKVQGIWNKFFLI